MKELMLPQPDDFHLHLRERGDLHYTVPHTAPFYGRALVMPNLKKPILTWLDAVTYHEQILAAAKPHPYARFTPLMTIQIVDATTPEMIRDAATAGVIAGKLYPAGVTTNSENGVRRIEELWPVFQEMAEVGMVLCLHGERPESPSLLREVLFLETLRNISKGIPGLRIVLEHLSTLAAVRAVEALPANVAATITAHHLLLTLDDVIGDKLSPHHFCKPIPKSLDDRKALIKAATSGNPKFFFGSDSAPHKIGAKHCASGCAGVFSSPVAIPLLAQIFETHGALARLEGFTSKFGAGFYKLVPNTAFLRLIKKDWKVPDQLPLDYIPFMAGQTLSWQVD
jgi:dihydroorotase